MLNDGVRETKSKLLYYFAFCNVTSLTPMYTRSLGMLYLPPLFLCNRLVHSGKQPVLSSQEHAEILTFGTRSGTRQGVEAHVFRVETPRDLSTWTRVLVQGVNNAVLLVREVSTSK